MQVIVKVSEPYTLIAGGYTSLRPVGQRRDYTAIVDGKEFKNTNKATICTLIRQYMYRTTGSNKVNFVFKNA